MCESATREALTALTPIRSRVLIAMANSPGLADEDVAAGLAERLAALRNQLTHVQDARRGQEPLSAAATAIFDYSEAMLRADIGWTESLVGKAGGMDKYDVKKAYRKLYAPPAKDFVVVDVPVFRYIAVDGQGDPNTSTAYAQAVESLFGVAYTVKFASKKQLDRDFTVGPLEALWRADDPSAFTKRDKSAWAWTVMIHQPDWVTDDMIAAAVEAVGKKKEPADVRQLTLEEGRCVQILHIGPYDDEGPTLDRLHNRYMPDNGLEFNGDHHEIYLSDVRRTAPEKLKTILRQPVKRA